MKIIIVGPGAMGCLCGGLLSEAGHAVWLLDRRADRARTIAGRGVVIEVDGSTRTVPVHATADAAEIGDADLVWIFVKAPDTATALLSAAPLLHGEATVGTLQNGLGNVEQITQHVDLHRVVCGTTSHGATALGWGRVRHAGSGPTVIAPAGDCPAERCREVSGMLTRAGIESTVSDDARSVLWSKIVISTAINPLTAAFDVRNGLLMERDDLRRLMHAAARETAAVAAAAGIRLSYSDPIAESEHICRCTAQNVSSMLQDVRHGRRTEIEQITGAVVETARRIGVAVPTNEMLLERVRERERETT